MSRLKSILTLTDQELVDEIDRMEDRLGELTTTDSFHLRCELPAARAYHMMLVAVAEKRGIYSVQLPPCSVVPEPAPAPRPGGNNVVYLDEYRERRGR